MKGQLNKFIVRNCVAAIFFILVGTFLFLSLLKPFYSNIYPILLLYVLLVNLLVFYLVTKKEYTPQQSSLIVVKSFVLKFFSYLSVSVLYFVLEKELQPRVVFIGILFSLYIVFTYLEVSALTAFYKRTGNNS